MKAVLMAKPVKKIGHQKHITVYPANCGFHPYTGKLDKTLKNCPPNLQ